MGSSGQGADPVERWSNNPLPAASPVPGRPIPNSRDRANRYFTANRASHDSSRGQPQNPIPLEFRSCDWSKPTSDGIGAHSVYRLIRAVVSAYRLDNCESDEVHWAQEPGGRGMDCAMAHRRGTDNSRTNRETGVALSRQPRRGCRPIRRAT